MYDYQYEFSETRKVLSEFFKTPPSPSENRVPPQSAEDDTFFDLNYTLRKRSQGEERDDLADEEEARVRHQRDLLDVIPELGSDNGHCGGAQTEQQLSGGIDEYAPDESRQPHSRSGFMSYNGLAAATLMSNGGGTDTGYATLNSPEVSVRSASNQMTAVACSRPSQSLSTEIRQKPPVSSLSQLPVRHVAPFDVGSAAAGNPVCSRNFTLSPETTDCDSGDLESELSGNEGSYHSSGPRALTAMPVLEDGLSSGNVSEEEDHDRQQSIFSRFECEVLLCRSVYTKRYNDITQITVQWV
jgi:hypothetical protein